MDSLDTIAFARALIDIDSTTGQERAAGAWLHNTLSGMAYDVAEQRLKDGRFNVFATPSRAAGAEPRIVFSTHFDCVPPFFPSSVEDQRLYGRGACDAKGILAAQVAAAERLRAAGESRFGLLFVVGEERGSDGAALANLSPPPGVRFLINGEPTDNRLAIGTRGVLRLRLSAAGRAAHSSAPEHGVSAIERLIDALVQLRSAQLPADSDLGRTFYTVGLIDGGVAPNVVPPHASAEVLFRTVGPPEEIRRAIADLERLVTIEEVLRVPPVRLRTFDGFDRATFPFTTDVPLLDRWGTPLLIGPGSFLEAHTARESIGLAEIEAAVDHYVNLAKCCLHELQGV